MVSQQKISSYLRRPYDLNAEDEQELRGIIQQHPYFSNAWLLLSRSLSNQKSPLLDDSLKKASMFAGNRALLYRLVNIEERTTEELSQVTSNGVTTSTENNTLSDAVAPAIDNNGVLPQETIQPPAQVEALKELVTEQALPSITETIALESKTPIDDFEFPSVEEDDTLTGYAESETKETNVPNNEESKVQLAYQEVFGETNEERNNVSEEFESFDLDTLSGYETASETTTLDGVSDTKEEYSYETTFDDLAFYPANVSIEEEIPEQEENTVEAGLAKIPDTDKEEIINAGAAFAQEEFEMEVGRQLPVDTNGFSTPVPTDTEEEFELNLGDYLEEAHNSKVLTQESQETKPLLTIEEDYPFAEKPAIENVYTEETDIAPIAFKLTSQAPTEGTNGTEQQQNNDSIVESATFFEWLEKLSVPTTEKKTIKSDENEGSFALLQTSVNEKAAQEIIDRFININPTISRTKSNFFNPLAKAKESDTPSDDLATETLARIYTSQHLYDKAIAVYNKLCSINPEKEMEYKAAIVAIETRQDD